MANLLTLLQRFDVAASEGDADAVNCDLSLNRCLTSVLESLHVRNNSSKHWISHQDSQDDLQVGAAENFPQYYRDTTAILTSPPTSVS